MVNTVGKRHLLDAGARKRFHYATNFLSLATTVTRDFGGRSNSGVVSQLETFEAVTYSPCRAPMSLWHFATGRDPPPHNPNPLSPDLLHCWPARM
jgi:hypothetical protein